MLLQLRSWWWQKKSIARISAWSRRRIGLLSLSPASDRSKACSMACCGGATRRPRRWACSRKYARTATAAMEYLSVDWLASSEVSFFFSRCWSTTARGASPTSGALIIIDSSFTELHLQSHSADTHCPAKGCVESTHASHGISMQSVPPGLSRFRMLKIHAAPASDPRSSAKGAASCPWIPWAPQDSNFFTAKRAVEGQSRLVSRWLSTRSNTLSMVRPASSVMISVTGKSCGKTLVTSSASMFNRGTKREEYNEGCMAAKVRYIVARIIKRISGMPHCPAMVMIGRIAPGWLASWRYLARKLVEVGCGKPTTNCEMFVKKTTRILWRCGRVVRSVSFECQVKAYKDRNAKSRDKSSSLQTLALLSASEELLLDELDATCSWYTTFARSTGFLPKAVFQSANNVVKRWPTQSEPKHIKPSSNRKAQQRRCAEMAQLGCACSRAPDVPRTAEVTSWGTPSSLLYSSLLIAASAAQYPKSPRTKGCRSACAAAAATAVSPATIWPLASFLRSGVPSTSAFWTVDRFSKTLSSWKSCGGEPCPMQRRQ